MPSTCWANCSGRGQLFHRTRNRPSAGWGHSHAQLLLERQSDSSLPSAILAVNGLLHQMGRIFQDNVKAMDSTRSQHTDHKLRRKIQEKKIAMGHKADDQEEQGYVGPVM